MNEIKQHLQDESDFFWNISGGNYFLKYWFYEENLISIEQIIRSILPNDSSSLAEYFLPEIISKEPEIYEKYIKKTLTKSFTKEYLNEFVELRHKYFNWLQKSNDTHDPSYQEIEKNPLRLAIKTDDIDSFQKILSSSNISINSKISESLIETYLRNSEKIPLINFAIEFNSIKIIKYLILNDVQITKRIAYDSILQRNYDVIHMVELKIKQNFGEEAFFCSISSWNFEMIEYALNNYDINFMDNDVDNPENDHLILNMIQNTLSSYNFIFIDSILLPFLRRNPNIFQRTIHDIIFYSLKDFTCYFLNEFMKFPDIDVNYIPIQENRNPFLTNAITCGNIKAVEILLKHPDIDINKVGRNIFSPFQFACAICSNVKILELFFNHPNFDINRKFSANNITGLMVCIKQKNIYGIEFILDHYPDSINDYEFYYFLYYCLISDDQLTLKILLKCYFKKNDKFIRMDEFIALFEKRHDFRPELINIFKNVLNEF